MTEKKITKVGGGENTPKKTTFVPTAEAKSKATQLRIIACVLWFLAICAQVGAITLLFKQPINMMWIIILIVVDLVCVVIGSLLWKKSNRLDPASKKDKFKFFMQSQLGLVAAIVAFLPLVIFILTSKNLDGKQKGILGGIAGAALVIAVLFGIDFNPPSVEEYSEQSSWVKELVGENNVYWTKSGTKYHLFNDCQYLKSDRTTEIFEGGTVADAYANNSKIKPEMNSLCSACEKRAAKEKGWTDEQLQQAKDKALKAVRNTGNLKEVLNEDEIEN